MATSIPSLILIWTVAACRDTNREALVILNACRYVVVDGITNRGLSQFFFFPVSGSDESGPGIYQTRSWLISHGICAQRLYAHRTRYVSENL